MSTRDFGSRGRAALRAVRFSRVMILVVVTVVATLASDWLREERVIFPAPLPKFTTVPAPP